MIENLGGKDYKPIYAYDIEEATPGLIKITRTTIVVRNAGCARSRYTLKLSLIF